MIDNHIKLKNEYDNLNYLTDTDIDIIFSYWGCDIIKFPLSRFVCDVERLEHNEPMETCGQGIIYLKDAFGEDIERITPDEEIYKMYHDHHRKLTITVNRQLTYYNNVVIVDCHSFTSKNTYDPDICIGTDCLHTPTELIDIVSDYFDKCKFTIDINKPYKGTIVPSLHSSNNNVKSIMIEINKNVYMNRTTIFKNIIDRLLGEIDNYEWNIA
jgi:N-formylglutamate amidohydrolase